MTCIVYTHPDVRMSRVMCAIDKHIPVVIGTTGFTAEELDRIDREARDANIGPATGNFSITAAPVQYFALIAARHVPDMC